MNEIASDNSVLHPMIAEIKDVIDKAKAHIAHQVNSELLYAYWNIGRIMVENEQSHPNAPITANRPFGRYPKS